MPYVLFFLFMNHQPRQTGHYSETWNHPIPFWLKHIHASCAIEICREKWSKPRLRKNYKRLTKQITYGFYFDHTAWQKWERGMPWILKQKWTIKPHMWIKIVSEHITTTYRHGFN
jgi:hypothetical protein